MMKKVAGDVCWGHGSIPGVVYKRKVYEVMKADTYLSHCYAIPETPSVLPLADEAFASVWKESEGVAAREFLAEIVGRDRFLCSRKKHCAYFLRKRWEGIFRLS